MNKTVFNEFLEWGSGFRIEAERDYKKKGEPLIFHLFMFGLHYKDDYELVGNDLEKLMKQAIREGKKSNKKFLYEKRNETTYEKRKETT